MPYSQTSAFVLENKDALRGGPIANFGQDHFLQFIIII